MTWWGGYSSGWHRLHGGQSKAAAARWWPLQSPMINAGVRPHRLLHGCSYPGARYWHPLFYAGYRRRGSHNLAVKCFGSANRPVRGSAARVGRTLPRLIHPHGPIVAYTLPKRERAPAREWLRDCRWIPCRWTDLPPAGTRQNQSPRLFAVTAAASNPSSGGIPRRASQFAGGTTVHDGPSCTA